MKSGEVHSRQMDNAMGYPPAPISFDDCVKKFYDCAEHSERQVLKNNLDSVVEMVEQLERLQDATEIIKLVSRGDGRV